MSNYDSQSDENAQRSMNGPEGNNIAGSSDIPMSDQFNFDTDALSREYNSPDFDPNTFPAFDLHNTNMPNFDCIWTPSPVPTKMALGELHEISRTQQMNMVNSNSFYNTQYVAPYSQNQMLLQESISRIQPTYHGPGLVPNMIPSGVPSMPMNSGSYVPGNFGTEASSISTGLTVPSTPQHSQKTNISFLANNDNNNSALNHVGDESLDRMGRSKKSFEVLKDEEQVLESRYVPVLQKPGPSSTLEQFDTNLQSRKTNSNLKKTRSKNPPRKITTINPYYAPNTKYTHYSYPSKDWDCFEYTEDGELDPARLYTTEELNKFLFEHPLGRDLALHIHRNPPRSRARYPTTHSHCCRFADCPFYPNNTINQGHWAVSFDELTTSHPDHDPYIVAGYTHLWCLEKYTDFPKICAELNIHPDMRKLHKEDKGRNLMALGTKAEEACVTQFIQVCQRGKVPESYPRFDMPGRPYEGTLTNRLACVKLRKEPRAVDGQRAARMKLAEYQGSNLRTHLGDLQKEVHLRNMSRSHKNQNRQIENVKHKRIFRGESFKEDDAEDGEEHGDEGVGEGEDEDGGAVEGEEDLENSSVPAPRVMGNVGEMSTTSKFRQFSLHSMPAAIPTQSRGKKRGVEPSSKKMRPSGDESEESDEEALRLQQEKLKIELRLILLRRKEKAAKRSRENVGDESIDDLVRRRTGF